MDKRTLPKTEAPAVSIAPQRVHSDPEVSPPGGTRGCIKMSSEGQRSGPSASVNAKVAVTCWG